MTDFAAWLDELIGLASLIVDGDALPRRTTTEYVAGHGIALSGEDDVGNNRSLITVSATGAWPSFPVADFTIAGAVLGTGTTPPLAPDANGALVITWATTSQVALSAQRTLPENFDGTAAVYFDFWVVSGTTDLASLTVVTSWDDGAAVTDAAVDAVASVTLRKITAVVSAADIPDTASFVTLKISPANTHTTNTVKLYAVRMRQ